ncbi:putative endonuclease [Streptococcus pneumoniae]|nr:putative endonuclease [Streptococcus pneumoniae]
MNKRKVSLEDFYKWYSLNKEELLNKATVGEKFNDKLKEEFLQEWPLDRILTMSIDEYVIGKGQQNKSLCYALEVEEFTFEIDSKWKHKLLNSLDDIGITLQYEELIAAYEKQRPAYWQD